MRMCMRIGLITPANVWKCPFIRIYTAILDDMGIEYDIISWNKDGCEKQKYQYEKRCDAGRGVLNLISYLQFGWYVKKMVRKNKYDKLIIFSPQLAIFIISLLLRDYKGKYIFDYRDLSIEQKKYLKPIFRKVLQNSFANVISSPGFKRCLPQNFTYYLSHNFNVNCVKEALGKVSKKPSMEDKIKILTIGAIRDYSSNTEVIKSLGNNPNFSLSFVGKGEAAKAIEEFANENNIENIYFEGYYPKERESEYILDSTFINIYYPRIITHDTALSNRFYNSLIFRRPMIVTKDTTQGDLAESYNVGIAIKDCSNLESEIKEFMKQDYIAYSQRCDSLLQDFLKDQNLFENIVREFLK